LTCGALDFDRRRFFLVFGVMRLVRFAVVALLARHYGDRLVWMLDAATLLQIVNADSLQSALRSLTLVGIAAASVMCAVVWSRTRPQLA